MPNAATDGRERGQSLDCCPESLSSANAQMWLATAKD